MQFNVKYISVVLWIFLLKFAESGKILGLFHFPIRSQHVLGSFLLKELAARGHEVTMISPYPLEKPIQNYTDIVVDNGLTTYMRDVFGAKFRGQKMNIIDKVTMGPQVFLDFERLFLESPEIKNLLQSDSHFDLVIVLYNLNEAMFGVGHHFTAPSIAICSVGASSMNNQLFANPAPYSMVPNIYTSSPETFCDRVINTIAGFGFEMILRYKSWPQQRDLLNRIFPKQPSLEEIMDSVQIALMNSHPAVEGSRPYMSNQIQIGGFYMKKPEKLPDDILKFLNEAKDGAILFSLGTAVKEETFPKERLDILMKVFARLKQRVIFKWKIQNENLPENVYAAEWLPQTGILAHKNVRLFATHAGLGGVAECIYYAVPAVCIPFFSDQPKNCDDMVRNGYAVRVDIEELSEEILHDAFMEILNNPSYKQTISKASDFYRDQPIDPLTTAIYWIEHVIKHKGASHFPKSIGTKLKLYEYLLLDIVVFFLVIFLFVFVILRAIFREACVLLFSEKLVKNKNIVSKTKKNK